MALKETSGGDWTEVQDSTSSYINTYFKNGIVPREEAKTHPRIESQETYLGCKELRINSLIDSRKN